MFYVSMKIKRQNSRKNKNREMEDEEYNIYTELYTNMLEHVVRRN